MQALYMKKVWRKASLSFVFLLLCGLLNFTSSYFKVFLFVYTGIASSVVGVVTAQIIDMQTIQILVSSCIIGPILKVGLGMPSFCNEKYLTASLPLLPLLPPPNSSQALFFFTPLLSSKIILLCSPSSNLVSTSSTGEPVVILLFESGICWTAKNYTQVSGSGKKSNKVSSQSNLQKCQS